MNLGNGRDLVRLLQLASAVLPVGAFSYSHGLEAAVEAGVVHDQKSANAWIIDLLTYSMASMEAPVLLRLIDAWRAQDFTAAAAWNDLFLASRETAELRAETVQMGFSLARLLNQLDGIDSDALTYLTELAGDFLSQRFRSSRGLVELAAGGRAFGLSLVVGGESGDGGAQDRAPGTNRRTADAARHRRPFRYRR